MLELMAHRHGMLGTQLTKTIHFSAPTTTNTMHLNEKPFIKLETPTIGVIEFLHSTLQALLIPSMQGDQSRC